TNEGIASPSHEAQAAVIPWAYSNAGITNLHETAYFECMVPALRREIRLKFEPRLIRSIKSNIGHSESEPAAGNSGLLKVIMFMEKGVIPETPLFIIQAPELTLKAPRCKLSARLPLGQIKAMHYDAPVSTLSATGGSNAHAIVEQASLDICSFYRSSYAPAVEDEGDDSENNWQNDEGISDRPYTLMISANDAQSLPSTQSTRERQTGRSSSNALRATIPTVVSGLSHDPFDANRGVRLCDWQEK
ncbi:Acyl transferase/acyl hydrolase/lysophospholipase, partial [Penicillium malachiteum]